MFWRKRATIAPEVHAYIRRRYEDLAVSIQLDIARDKGLYNYYAPWLDYMLNRFDLPEHIKERNTLVITDSSGRHIGCSGAVKNKLDYYNQSNEHSSKHRKEGKHHQKQSFTEVDAGAGTGERNEPCKSRSRGSDVSGCLGQQIPQTTQLIESARAHSSPQQAKSTVEACYLNVQGTPSNCLDKKHTSPSPGGTAPIVLLNEDKLESSIVLVREAPRPQSVDSYYLRIDKAFQDYRNKKAHHQSGTISDVESCGGVSGGDGDGVSGDGGAGVGGRGEDGGNDDNGGEGNGGGEGNHGDDNGNWGGTTDDNGDCGGGINPSENKAIKRSSFHEAPRSTNRSKVCTVL